jgi:hypothetical protein
MNRRKRFLRVAVVSTVWFTSPCGAEGKGEVSTVRGFYGFYGFYGSRSERDQSPTKGPEEVSA